MNLEINFGPFFKSYFVLVCHPCWVNHPAEEEKEEVAKEGERELISSLPSEKERGPRERREEEEEEETQFIIHYAPGQAPQ